MKKGEDLYLKACRDRHAYSALGGCYGHILVATGRAEVMLDPILQIWDCAALRPILEEAGGTFTDWHGIPTHTGGNGLSTNGLLFEAVMEIIRSNP